MARSVQPAIEPLRQGWRRECEAKAERNQLRIRREKEEGAGQKEFRVKGDAADHFLTENK